MKLWRKISLGVAVALAAATMGLIGASPALAAGRISTSGNCGDLLDLRVRVAGQPLSVTIGRGAPRVGVQRR